ncbi:hypothetical protein BC826DRAFT_972931 [Russula brevipes]|nr:hypothetical protein BC826DRAFT_972931 [Russula brevipes]
MNCERRTASDAFARAYARENCRGTLKTEKGERVPGETRTQPVTFSLMMHTAVQYVVSLYDRTRRCGYHIPFSPWEQPMHIVASWNTTRVTRRHAANEEDFYHCILDGVSASPTQFVHWDEWERDKTRSSKNFHTKKGLEIISGTKLGAWGMG